MDQSVKNLCWALMNDEKGEGDMIAFLGEDVAQALQLKLIIATACDRPFKNIRLTEKGWRV